MNHLRIDLIILSLASLLGFTKTSKSCEKKQAFYFEYFLLITLLVEILGWIYQQKGKNNLLLFNAYSVFEFAYLTWFFKLVITGRSAQKFIAVLFPLLPFACLLNIFFIQGLHSFHTYTYALGSICMVGMSILYLIQLFRSDSITNPVQLYTFWVTCAIIFFFTTSVSIIGIFNYVAVLSKPMVKLSQSILLIVDCIFYLLFIIAFICRNRFQKYILNS